MSSPPNSKPLLLLVGAACLWSMGGVLIKSVDWNPLAIAGGRSAVASLYLILVLGLPRVRLTWPVVGAALCYAATMLAFVPATRLTTAANAILLQYMAPVHVAVLAPRFLGEPTTRRDWLALGAALLGMTFFFWGNISYQGQLGNALALASSFSYAGLALCMRKIKDGQGPQAILLGNVIAALFCVPAYFHGPLPDGQGIFWIILLGVVQTGVPYQLYARAIRHVRAMEAILVPMIEPVLNPVWVFLVIGERPSAKALVGGAVVLGAATIQGLLAMRPPRFKPLGPRA